MRTIYPDFESDSFKKSLMTSAMFHLGVALFFILKSLIFSGTNELIDSAIRVDLVGLPEKANEIDLNSPEKTKSTEAEPSALPEKPMAKLPEKKLPVENDAIKLEKAKNAQKNALTKLKAQQAIEDLKSDQEKKQKLEAASKLIKGTQVSAGSELTGVSRLQYDKYKGILERHVKENWALPEWLRHKKLRAVVLVKIDETGKILSLQMLKTSGNPAFDEIALDTVEKAAPLPAPPEKFFQKLKIDGITFGFPE